MSFPIKKNPKLRHIIAIQSDKAMITTAIITADKMIALTTGVGVTVLQSPINIISLHIHIQLCTTLKNNLFLFHV